ncbi:MG2 domain-containing protein [uncultured Tenacibaculum sp.]|uniref:alpha-2-macroglobulin family protein n=1 Tax=uncultured Tenacibaculum sp. TaxID=174713 RepID=UPI00261FB967|nr:MG2 domain-containing protein [uncultured Tenacibaculum sp.]
MKKVLSYCVLVLLLLVSGCKKKETKEVSDVTTFTEYISVYPEKLISIAPKLDFYLNKKVDVEELGDDIITMNPKVKGKVEINNSILSFVPDEKLESNKEYSLTLHLDKLYSNVDKSLEDFTILLKTKPLQFSLALQAPSIYDKDWYYVEGSLNASDVIEEQKVAELVKANYNGAAQKIKFDVSSDGYTNFVRFKIDSLQRFADDKIVKVNWDGGIINSTSKGEREIVITGKSNFKVLSFDVFNDNKQRIDINFSDPINSNQNLKGLIQFVNTQKQNFTTKIKNNVISVYPKSSIRSKVDIEVFKGIKNKAGYTLKNNVIRTLYFEQLKPELSFIKSGTILPNSNNLKVNFTAVNLKAVDATVYKIYKSNVLQFLQGNNLNNQGNIRYVGRPTAKYTVNLSNQGLSLGKPNAFAVDLSDLVDVENGAVYRVELSYHKEYSNYSCDGEENTSTIVFGKKEVDTRRFDRAGYSYYNDDYYDDYNWNERKDPCKKSYYRNKKISRNFLASDLGVIVKKGNNDNTFVAVTNLLTTDPVNAAKVELINLQQQTIVAASTNKEGVASFESVQGAYFAKVSNNESTTYVKLNDGNALSMSKFDVSGAKLQKGIKGYIYGERGVWRPGDQMFLTFVLNDKANPIPEEHPIKFELVNPQGKIIDRKIVQKNKLNVYTYAPKTDAEAITGNWKLRVNVGVANFNKELKVETIKPNRLKIKVNTSEEFVKYGKPINGDLEVKWLHGAIARGLKFDIESKFSSTRTTFPKYDNYVFDDVTRSLRTSNSVVASGNLNNEGKVSFTKKTDLGNRVPGMVRASFITKVYENGGDFSTDVYSMKVSPYKSYAGLNLAEEQQSKNYLFTDQEYAFNVASVNEEGKGIPNDLEVKVYKLNWRWWWSSSDDGLSYYDGSTERSSYETKRVTTNANGKGSFSLKVDKGDWGRYLIKVKDKKSKHVTSAVVYFDWPSWYGTKRGSQDKTNATMLVFSSDKDEYNVNEKATVKFPSSAGGRALITIENGTEVLDHFWVETQDKQTDFSFPVLSTYTPNVFVNISLLQEHAQTKNDLPIRMYGAIPMLVNDPATKLAPEIQLADELQPESVAKIRVKEKNAKAMTYTIALVDDGLLDLTRFKTPNPWSSFYRRQSLGVKTWDIFDDVIGAYGGEVNQILSIGGDEAKAGSKNKKANRFKPMVSFLGPFKLGSGEVKTHEIKIPNYVGSVRAMVVASNIDKEAYGSDEKNAFVRKPVMVLASLPRKITPKETVTLPVTVFAMKENVKNVKVTVKPDPSYSIVGDQTQTIRFDQPDEKMAYFTLKVNDFKGIGKVRVEASSGSEKAFYEVEIDVLNPNPITTEVKDLVLKSGEEKTIDFTTFGTKGTNTASVELSTLPPMNFTSRMEYLIRYPHGCVEQTTSGAFPQLYFPELFELPKERKQSIERNIKAAIKRLATFQKSDGGLSYWPGSGSSNSWGTSYAGHFLLEAAKRGYALPIGFKAKWLNYQKNEARRWRNSSKYYNNELTQAYRLYTLSLANSPDLASMNRLRETSGISNLSKRRLAAAYALIGKKSIAQSILSTINSNDYSNRYYYNYGSEIRDKAMSLETYTLIGDEVKAIKLAKDIAERLSSSEWMSTQTTSYSLLAIAQYALKNGENAGINTNYTWNGNKANVSTSKSLFVKDLKGLLKENKFVMSNNSNSPLYVRVYNRGILPVGEEKVIQKNFDVAITYKDKNNNRIDVSNLSQGTNFVAEITIRNATGEKVENIALTQYLPSGWEVVNTRFTEFGSNTNSATVDFTDIRDASISNYFTLQGYKSKTFRVLLNASYLGDYYLPGVQAEAMYDNDYISRTKGQWIKVVK